MTFISSKKKIIFVSMEIFKDTSNVFEILYEAISEGIIIVNKAQEIIASNESANQLFGYNEGELINERLEVLIPRKYHKAHPSHVSGFLKNSEKRQMGNSRDLYGLRKDNTMFPVEVGLNPFTIKNDHYVMALITDITERKKAENELKHWANIFNETLNEIFIFDAKTLKFINANKGAQLNIGYTLDELKKITPIAIKPEYTEEEFRHYITPLLNKTETHLVFTTIHQRKDGTTYPVEIHLQPSHTGDLETLVAIILDITERVNYTKKLEKTVKERTLQLQEALEVEKELNELKTKFLSLVSHEFKTPLSGVLSSATLIGKYDKGGEQQEKRIKHVNRIKSKVKYLNNIINDFLSIERLDNGKISYKYVTFSLSKIINEVIYDANMLLKEGQKIIYPDGVDDIVIEFDEKILELVLTNLISNAIKYSPENTQIKVVVLEEEEQLKISVTDAGIGIPEKEQKFVFNRYFRAGNALTSQGTGIGLNIVRSHLKNLKGSITFTSKQNIGTTFTVTIPTKQS